MFMYEQLPLFCFYCGKIGYGERNCGKKMTDSRIYDLNKGQYGEWLRAAYVRSSNKKGGYAKKDLTSNTLPRQVEYEIVRKDRVDREGTESLILDVIKGERDFNKEGVKENRNNEGDWPQEERGFGG